jgi:preprotein translocase subunit YajC
MAKKRSVEISRTYTPSDRTVTVAGIPAVVVTVEDATDTVIEPSVNERVQTLVARALRANAEPAQHITYSGVD